MESKALICKNIFELDPLNIKIKESEVQIDDETEEQLKLMMQNLFPNSNKWSPNQIEHGQKKETIEHELPVIRNVRVH